MSKTTKIIAALGVVAGLGVAALPAFTYAANPPSVTGDVDVYVEVAPAIAMTITGNNDDNAHYGTQADPSATPDPIESDNAPVNVKDPSGATTIDGLNVSSFEVETATKASSSWTKLLPNASVHGNNTSGSDNGFYSTITVYTNNASGFNLGISGEGTSNALGDLTKIYSGTTPSTPATIPATGLVKAGTAGWGYSKSVQTDASDSTPQYLTAANNALTTSSTKTSGGNTTVVYYGVSTSNDQETGVYHATVTYTATCQ